MGINGEPSTPSNPAMGIVWQAIVSQIDCNGSESDWVSVSDLQRAIFAKHPISVGGGGAVELKTTIEGWAGLVLDELAVENGAGAVTREDGVFAIPHSALRRAGISERFLIPLIEGDAVRDYALTEIGSGLFPYEGPDLEPCNSQAIERFLWPYRRQLSERVAFGKTQIERGLPWFTYSMLFRERFVRSKDFVISFAEIATHNHFVLDHGGKVFNRTAPVIKLPAGASEEEHLGLLGLLNSSTACFWFKQVCHNKGSTVDQQFPAGR
jgi:hypothetical protein